MINVIKYKTQKGYSDAIKVGNTSKSTILQTHEPFNIIVFNDTVTVRRDPRTISRITEIEDLTQIPTGNALLAVNRFEEYLFADEDRVTEAYRLIRSQKLRVIEDMKLVTGFVVEIPDNMTYSKFLSTMNKTFRGENVFSVIEEDFITEAQSCDYYAWPYGAQWHLDDLQSAEAYELLNEGDYNSEEAITYGEWSTRDVAIIDGHGFEFTHPDLDNNEYPENHPGRYMTRQNWNCTLNNDNPQPGGLNDKHGTVMAGIAASGWADRRFLRGVGLDHINAQCLKIGWNVSQTGTFSTATSIVVRALNKAAININCASIVMPYSQAFYSPFTNIFLRNIKLYGRSSKGMPIFAPSGNNGLSNFSGVYPASYEHVMAIGASNQSHLKADFSNYGEGLFATAPGVSIFAIDRCCGRGYNINPDSTYGSVVYFSGTSASAVIAATIAATMVIAYPGITELKIRSILEITARRIGPYTYDTESNEIGLFNGISPETGNGILSQLDAVQAALDMAEDDNAGYVNYQIDDFNIRWRAGMSSPWETSQPIPAGVQYQGEVTFTITNNGPNIAIFGSNAWPIQMLVTLDEGGPMPNLETPMVRVQSSMATAGTGTAVNPGESQTLTIPWSTDNYGGRGTCGLNGNYYLVCVLDRHYSIPETSEEDNFRAELVEFTTTNPLSEAYCDPQNDTMGAILIKFYDTSTEIGYDAIGQPDYYVPTPYQESFGQYTNLFPLNEDLQLSNLIVTGFTDNLYQISFQVTNLGNTAIQQFSLAYELNPGSSMPAQPFSNNLGISYMGRNFSYNSNSSSTEHVRYKSYQDEYPEAMSYVYPAPPVSNPLMPGQSRNFTSYIPMSPLYFPAILTGRIIKINYRGVTNAQSIHIAQSNILYFP